MFRQSLTASRRHGAGLSPAGALYPLRLNALLQSRQDAAPTKALFSILNEYKKPGPLEQFLAAPQESGAGTGGP
jgi:hypothetical protein